jgi:hypothetical protein
MRMMMRKTTRTRIKLLLQSDLVHLLLETTIMKTQKMLGRLRTAMSLQASVMIKCSVVAMEVLQDILLVLIFLPKDMQEISLVPLQVAAKVGMVLL